MKRLICLILCIAMFTIGVSAGGVSDEEYTEAATEGVLQPECRSAILIERSTGQVLFEQNADEKLPIASVTKVMTLLLVCEAIDSGSLSLDDMVTVSDNAASMGGSQAFMEPGEQLSVDEMLKAVVVSSCNDGAVALAEHIAGSEQGFVTLMNERAKQLGMNFTDFVNTTGLDDDECHLSTARDISIASRELLGHDIIRNYTTIWMDTIRNGSFGLSNTNKLIRFYNGATGLKTGSTSKAKYCLSASAMRDGMELIAVILCADTSDHRFSSAKLLLDYGFANYAIYCPENGIESPIKVVGGQKKETMPYCAAGSILVEKKKLANMNYTLELPEELSAPVEKGQEIGRAIYKSGDEVIREEPVICTETIEKMTFSDYLSLLVKKMFFC